MLFFAGSVCLPTGPATDAAPHFSGRAERKSLDVGAVEHPSLVAGPVLKFEVSGQALRALFAIIEDPNAEDADRIRAAEAILNRGLGKVAEPPDEKKQTFAFFHPVTPERLALSERLVNSLPENTDGDPNSNVAG